MGTMIMGTSRATAAQMQSYIHRVNPDVPGKVIEMLHFYLSEGEAEGVRGDIAFAQSCLETGNFTFRGSAVTLDQNNFAGIGVTSNGMKGNSWDTPQLGIRAQVQHLKAYGSTEPLEQDCVDDRFKWVKRSSAPFVEWLGQQENPLGSGWAAGKNYGCKILNILNDVLQRNEGDNAMKVFLSVGHSILKSGACTSADGTAQGGVNEYQYCKALVPYVKKYLELAGCHVDLVICPERKFSSKNEERPYKLNIENNGDYDVSCELHLNAANGRAAGGEVYANTAEGRAFASRVDAKLDTVFKDRGGVKSQSLYMLNQTKAPAILVEVFFCDSASDYAKAKSVGMERIGRLIAEGITNTNISETVAHDWLELGDTGDAVKEMQSALNQAGYNLSVDGIYGKKTKEAVIDFQNKHGLSPDGLYGQKTKDKLLAEISKSQWIQQGGRWWYRHADGSYTKNGWEKIGGTWYYFDAAGWMKTGWVLLGDKWYYLKSSGAMASNELLKIRSELFYFTAEGHMGTTNSRGALA